MLIWQPLMCSNCVSQWQTAEFLISSCNQYITVELWGLWKSFWTLKQCVYSVPSTEKLGAVMSFWSCIFFKLCVPWSLMELLWICSFVQKDQGTRLSLILKEDKSNKVFLSWCLTINCLCSYWSIHRDKICEKSSTRLLHKKSKNKQIKKHTTSVLG